jgi:hypothetical protein
MLFAIASCTSALLCSCGRQGPTFKVTKSGQITCRLVAEASGKEAGQVRLMVELYNASTSNQYLLEPSDGSNIKYYYRKLNDGAQAFHSLLLPIDGAFGSEVIKVSPAKSLFHETILGMDPGEYELYAEYFSRASAKGVSWNGAVQSSGVILHLPREGRRR